MPIPTDHSHRPWPCPAGGWLMFMCWRELLFMHWPVPAASLRELIPRELEIDTFDGSAWVGVVPFRMTGIRARCLPPMPGTSAFAELNVRTYVTVGGKPGVWFFSLDAANKLAVRAARRAFNLPYYDADMSCASDPARPGWIDFLSTRTHRRARPACFAARYRPTGPARPSARGSLEYFLTERYCLYTADEAGKIYRGEIAHAPWPLQPAEADVSHNRMTAPIGLELPRMQPVLHYAHRLDAVAWRLRPVTC